MGKKNIFSCSHLIRPQLTFSKQVNPRPSGLLIFHIAPSPSFQLAPLLLGEYIKFEIFVQPAVTWGVFVASFYVTHSLMIFQPGNCPHALLAIQRRICSRLTQLSWPCPGVKVRKRRPVSQSWRHQGTVVLTSVNVLLAKQHIRGQVKSVWIDVSEIYVQC